MRLPARFFLTGAAVLAVSSCYSDRTAAPIIPSVSGNPVLRALAVETIYDFVIPTSGTSVNLLDAYTLHFPAGSVCDPNAADTQAGYAAAQWDAPCTVATQNINVRATLKWQDGVLYADFQPSLRFVPNKSVTISTQLLEPVVAAFRAAGVKQGWSVGFAPGIGQGGITDALADPSLKTVVVGSTGVVFRRIKHFSGYMIIMSDGTYVPCDPAQGDPLCVWYDEDPRFKP